ncbi:MAG: Hsp70 family protein, partial [Clostridia bacterium]|nr:Hsp70 family protein [Clostridia bacterium]
DKGTGKEQHITITSSTNMSQEDIDRAVKEAEKYAEEDKKAKEAVDVKNHAETLIFQSEKTLNELGDKADPADAEEVKNAIEKLKETLKSGNVEAIKADSEAVEKSFYKISEKLYAQNAQAGGDAGFDPNAGANGGAQDGTYYNANFEDNSNN